jgi:uncharacterized membrane protein YhaH (DUF805 family)
MGECILQDMNKCNRISVTPLTIACILESVAVLLITISVAGQFCKYKLGFNPEAFLALFDLSLEMNIPTFFSVLLLLLASLLLQIITLLKRRLHDQDTMKWAVLALGFLYMAYDEGFQVHEDLVGIIRPMLWKGDLGIFYYAWVIPGLLVVAVLLLYFWKFLFRLPVVSRNTFVAAAVCYLAGCIGFEMVGGYYNEAYGSFDSLTYNLISSIEESLEMTGVVIFIFGLLEYLGDGFEEICFQFKLKR